MLYRAGATTTQRISLNIPLLIITILVGFLLVTIPNVLDLFSNRNGSVPQVGGATNQIDLTPVEISFSRETLLKDYTQQPETGEAVVVVRFSNEQGEVLENNDIVPQLHVSADGLNTFSLEKQNSTTYVGSILAENFEPGIHSAVVTIGEWQSEARKVTVTYPLYVVWTLDWEGYDVKQECLDTIARQSSEHAIPVTHFFNPRIYTNPELSTERANELTQWVINRRDEKGDDIGLHLHMQPDMVQAAGVTVREDAQHWGSNLHDGYDVLTSEYSYEEMVKMLNWSKNIFGKHGLGTPTMYRAGGWYADEDVLQAVHDTGFVLDSSARTHYAFGHDKVEGHWTTAPDQGPYRLNLVDQNDVNGISRLWEFPNNGADSWSFTALQMVERFSLQHDEVLTEPKVIVFLSHPEWYNVDAPKMDQVFAHTDQFLHNAGRGNVVYANLSSVYTIWQDK